MRIEWYRENEGPETAGNSYFKCSVQFLDLRYVHGAEFMSISSWTPLHEHLCMKSIFTVHACKTKKMPELMHLALPGLSSPPIPTE